MNEQKLNEIIDNMSVDQLKDFAKVGLLFAFDLTQKAFDVLRKL